MIYNSSSIFIYPNSINYSSFLATNAGRLTHSNVCGLNSLFSK